MKRLVLAGLLALPALGMCQQDANAFFGFSGYRCGTYNVSFPRIRFNFGIDTAHHCNPGLPSACHPGGGGFCPPGGCSGPGGPGVWYLHFPQGGQQGFVPANPHYAGTYPTWPNQPQPGNQLPNPTPVTAPAAPNIPAPAVNNNGTQPTSYDPYAAYQAGVYQYYYSSGYNVPSYWYGR